MECPALTNEEEWADLYDRSPPHPLRLEGEDRWEAKIHTPVPVTWHSKHQLASETNSQKPRGIGKTKKKDKKTISDPLTQTNTRHIKPESVDHWKKKKIGKKGKKWGKKNSINYLIRNLESHTISQRELRSELVIYFWYISGKQRCSQYQWFSVEAGFNLCNGITETVGSWFSTAASKIPLHVFLWAQFK